MNPTIDGFKQLQSLVHQTLIASLANNQIMLLFEDAGAPRTARRLTLRINHPWSLFFHSVIVGESREFFAGPQTPAAQQGTDRDRWSLGFANWVPGKLTGLSVCVNSPDLRLVFQSGHVLECTSLPDLPASWSLHPNKGPVIVRSQAIARMPWQNLGRTG